MVRTAEPVLGRLTINDWREGNAENRALRVAQLKDPTISFAPELLLPLFDPVVLSCDRRGMVLSGFECERRPNGEVARVLQAWWLQDSVKKEE